MNKIKSKIWKSPFARHLGRFYVSHIVKSEIKRLLKKEDSLVLFVEGVSTIGDASLFLSSIPAYASLHPDKKILVMTSKLHYKLCTYFIPKNQIRKKSNVWRYLIRLDFDSFFPLEYFVFNNRVYSDIYGMIKPSFFDSAFVKWRNMRVPFETTTIDYYAKFRLHLPNSWQPRYPRLPCVISSQKVIAILAKNKPFILLNTASRTGPGGLIFLEKIAPIVDYLSKHGFLILTNVLKKDEPVAGTERLECGIEDLYLLCQKASLFISVRSGILDFVVSSGCPIISLLVKEDQNVHYPLTSWKTSNHIDEIPLSRFDIDYLKQFMKEDSRGRQQK